MKFIIPILAIAGLAAGGYFLYQNRTAQPRAAAQGRATTATVESRDIRFEITAAGDIGPADQVSVRSEVNGRIVELPVDIGDQVKKGDLLCRLDDKDLQIERSQRLIEIDAARLQLQKARRTFDRQRQLLEKSLVSQEVFDDAKTEFDLATNAIDRAEQSLRLVDDKLRKTRMDAPFDCTVLTRPVSLGQTVSGAAGFNSGTEIMTIANLNEMIVNAHVNQADVIRLNPGRELEIQAESVPGVKMKGVVERIAPQAVIKNGIKGFSARIAIRGIDPRVRPGMTAILSIPVSSADNVLAVPLAAVFTEGGQRFVFVRKDDAYERRPVTLGVTDYSHAEIVQGLAAGEVVALDKTVTAGGPRPPGNGGTRGGEAAAGSSPRRGNGSPGATSGATSGANPAQRPAKPAGS
ncbi:MAG: hypothetical protein RJA22_1469 [Verrucomicrobiota bacterium]|jgi:RND family efflux transporter MFP subunit